MTDHERNHSDSDTEHTSAQYTKKTYLLQIANSIAGTGKEAV
jgi:hypothetical protein